MTPTTPSHPRQGDPALLATPTARELLSSAIPARMAYLAVDGTPRIVPTWFHWTGHELVMATFVAAPHVTRPAARLRDLRVHPDVAVSIDTEDTPPRALMMRGQVMVEEVAGVVPEYAESARHHLGDAAEDYLAMLADPGTRMARIALRPSWVGLLDYEQRLPVSLGGVAS
jgi:hypothetical protein